MAWTAPRTWVTGELVSASLMNTHVRDNLRFLKGLDGTITLESQVNFHNDAAFYAAIAGGNPVVNFDSNDYLAYNRAGNYFDLAIGGTTYGYLSTTQHKFPVNRQGAAGTNWTTAGTTDEAETGAFVQCGSVNIDFGAGTESAAVTVTLPVALTSTQSAVGFAISQTDAEMICNCAIAGTTQLVITGRHRNTSGSITGTKAVYWFVIGQ